MTPERELRADVLVGVTPERSAAEAQLALVLPLPAQWTTDWARSRPGRGTLLVRVSDSTGALVGGIVTEIVPSRALPGHRSLRVERLGVNPRPDVRGAALRALGRFALEDRRLLRVDSYILTRDPRILAEVGALLQDIGFTKETVSGYYDSTVVVDLRPPEEDVFGSFSSIARSNIRKAAKSPVELFPVEDIALAPRLSELWRETLARSGVPGSDLDWRGPVELSRSAPDRSRIVGLRRVGTSGCDGVLAFSWACFHGDHATYEEGASSRPPDLKLGLSHAPMWELMKWAKARGATWFDLGGVRDGSGVSKFKSYFSKDVEYVREGWHWVVHPVRYRVSLAVRASAAAARSAARRGSLLIRRGG